jgi:hypothetical protein
MRALQLFGDALESDKLGWDGSSTTGPTQIVSDRVAGATTDHRSARVGDSVGGRDQ